MTKNSTDYYRENKKKKKVIHICPHCDYTTTGPKITLKHHIDAKHKKDSEKPFQCIYCPKGFAQKSHLINHTKKQHNICMPCMKKIGITYEITIQDIIPNSKKTRARFDYYKNNPIIKSTNLNQNKHQYLENIFLRVQDINYDSRNGYIRISKTPIYVENKRYN